MLDQFAFIVLLGVLCNLSLGLQIFLMGLCSCNLPFVLLLEPTNFRLIRRLLLLQPPYSFPLLVMEFRQITVRRRKLRRDLFDSFLQTLDHVVLLFNELISILSILLLRFRDRLQALLRGLTDRFIVFNLLFGMLKLRIGQLQITTQLRNLNTQLLCPRQSVTTSCFLSRLLNFFGGRSC